jgi:hypothetical protein
MVALNPAYASSESTRAVKNRVGDFFCGSGERVGVNRLSIQQPRLENELTFTITASGRPFFINADPIGFAGGMNWFAYARGNPLNYIDPEGTNPLLYWGAVALRYGATRAYAYAAPIVTAAAVRSGQAIARGAQAGYSRASQLVQQGLGRANVSTHQAQQAVSSQTGQAALKVGFGISIGAGALNQIAGGPIDTSGLAGVDFGSTPIGATIDIGIQAFNGGGASVGIVSSGINAVVPAAQNFFSDVRETFGTPTFTDGLGADPFAGVNFDSFGGSFNSSTSSGPK